jgi:hypothetical protein
MVPALLRRRAAQAVVLVAVVGFGPLVARELWPAATSLVPPSMLLLSTLLTGFLALAAWRTEWVVTALFGGAEASQRMDRVRIELHRLRITAAVALFIDGVLIALWVKSLL